MPFRKFPLSISDYSILLAIAILALLGLFGLFTQAELKQVNREVDASRQSAARQELGDAVARAAERVRDNLVRLAAWDEVYQQLETPGYYSYWRTHRLSTWATLDDSVINVDIYGSGKQSLSGIAASDIPDDLFTLEVNAYLTVTGGVPIILAITPVRDKTDPDGYLGWIAVRSKLMDRLPSHSGFHFLDATTLKPHLDNSEAVPLDAASDAFDFMLRDHSILEDTRELVADSVVRLGLIVGAFILVLLPLLLHFLSRPLLKITEHIDRLKQSPGGLMLDPLSGILPVAEIEKIRESLNDYQARLLDVHASLDEKNREMWNLAHQDALTGMRNRRAFDRYWQETHPRLHDHHRSICFILFDLNHFKALNDTYGHQVGDAILKSAAVCIDGELDLGESLYRIGGDEFAAFLPDYDPQSALALAERCERAVARYPFEALGVREPVKISIGIAHTRADNPNALHSLQWKADVAMYQAKRPGKANIVLFEEGMAVETQGVFSNWVNNAVYEAINHGTGLTIFYQPIVALNPQRATECCYYEALVRIRHDDELIMPSNIFPVVEARRLELEFDRAVLSRILEDLHADYIPRGRGVSINLSGPSVVHEGLCELLDPFIPFLRDYRIVIEITETALITQLGLASLNLERLRRSGFKIALDDFGSGYSSVRYLATMPVDIVKFDTSLIQSLQQETHRKIVLYLAHMIVECGYTLVAEGIENEELMEYVSSIGFDYGQGYCFGRPLAADALAEQA